MELFSNSPTNGSKKVTNFVELDQYGRPFPKDDKPVPRTAADCVIVRKNN